MQEAAFAALGLGGFSYQRLPVPDHLFAETVRALPGAGTGLVGIAERVELAGGSLDFGPAADGTFVLRATLPW